MRTLASGQAAPHASASKELPLRAWSTLVALIAVMVLAISGGPSVARELVCDPCPPDCPMMMGATSDAPQSSPAPDDKGKAPCEQMALCQAPVFAVPPLTRLSPVRISHVRVARVWNNTPEAPSRPPDRTLRPPISL